MVCVYNVAENQRWDRFDTYYSERAERDEDSVSHLHSQMILQGERDSLCLTNQYSYSPETEMITWSAM